MPSSDSETGVSPEDPGNRLAASSTALSASAASAGSALRGPGLTHLSSLAARSFGSTGLAIWSCMPASRQRSRSPAIALAVIARIGKSFSALSLRISRVAVSPSITGICMSISTTS